MSKLEQVKSVWYRGFQKAAQSEVMRRVVSGQITTEQYASVLCEIYHQVRRHPAALASMTLRLKGKQIDMVPSILKHALSETGHDELALKDLETLGYSSSCVVESEMLPETKAILGYMYSLLTVERPLAFLGYLFHLEFMPTASGASYINGLKSAGIPEEACTFIQDHATIDVAHNKLMERYLNELVESDQDLRAIQEAAETTIQLYVNMLTAALNRPLEKRTSLMKEVI